MSSSTTHQRKRRRHGQTGDTVQDAHKNRASREAERNAEAKARSKEISSLLRNKNALSDEIAKLKQEPTTENAKQIKVLEDALRQRQVEEDRRFAKQEKDSEVARKRKLAAGLLTGPKPPDYDPPLRGPEHPAPPPPDELPIPPPPPPPLINHSFSTSLPAPMSIFVPPPILPQKVTEDSSTSVAQQKQEEPVVKKNMFIPTNVAVRMKKEQQSH